MESKYKFKGLLSHTDKYNHAYIIFMSNYHMKDFTTDHTKKILYSYDKKFKLSIDTKTIPEDINKIIVKSPIKNNMYMVCINKTKCFNLNNDLVAIDELKTREIIISASIKNYTFCKKQKDSTKCIIKGWKINCTSFKII